MDARTTVRLETAVDAGAAMLFAFAVGYAFWAVFPGQWQAGLGGPTAFALCFAGLRRVEPVPSVVGVPAANPVRDLLAEADRSLAEAPAEDVVLVLDDVLAALGPDSRVVRLFEPEAAPTPGQLKRRIDRHLDNTREPAAVPDASHALHEALADLRRSLK